MRPAPGMRVKVLSYPDSRVKNQMGTILEEYDDYEWYIKMDKDKGFKFQKDCWIFNEKYFIVLGQKDKNASYRKLLDKEY